MTVTATRKPLTKGTVEILDRDTGTVLSFLSYEALDLYRLTGQQTWTSNRPVTPRDGILPGIDAACGVGW